MEIDGADGIEATGLAAGSVGDGAVEASAQHGDSRPKKRQRREEEGGAGEELRRRRTQETACCLVAASHVHFFFLGAWRCTGWPNITAEDEMLTSEMRLTGSSVLGGARMQGPPMPGQRRRSGGSEMTRVLVSGSGQRAWRPPAA